MRLTRMVASIVAVCLVTGLIIYGGIFLRPDIVGSTPLGEKAAPRYLYSIGGASGAVRPNAVAVANGRVYITDGSSGKVFVYTEKGRRLFEFGKTGDPKSDLTFPNGIAVTGEGSLIVADSVKNDIRVYSREGKYLRTLAIHEKFRPGYISRGPDNLFYVSDLLNNRILVINEKGRLMRTIADSNRPLSYPQGTAIDRQGRLWVADGGNYSIKTYNPKGKVEAEIKSGGAPQTPLSMVRGIAFDKIGRAYVTDTINHQIRVFDPDGMQLSVFSWSEQGEELVFPTGVVISDGKLFVLDRGAGNVRVFSVK